MMSPASISAGTLEASRARAVILHQHGGPRELRIEDHDPGDPGPGEILIRQTAIGVNFHDVYVRTGEYRSLALPGIPGIEAAGVILSLGAGVTGLAVGDRIAYMAKDYGAYASHRRLPAASAIPLPDDVDDETAASMMVRGLTLQMLVDRVHSLRAEETILVQSAAGGVGLLLVHYASAIGARVIGTVGGEEKVQRAIEAGCSDVILYREENVVERVMALTASRGVNVVYDSVGRDTFAGSLASLRACGHLVMFGQSSGPVEPISLGLLAERSLTLSRPILFDYIDQLAERDAMVAAMFEALRTGALVPPALTRFSLSDAPAAHAALEDRSRTGCIVLIPDMETEGGV